MAVNERIAIIVRGEIIIAGITVDSLILVRSPPDEPSCNGPMFLGPSGFTGEIGPTFILGRKTARR